MKDGSIILGKQSQKVYYAQFKDVNVYDFSNVLALKPIEEQPVKKEKKMTKLSEFLDITTADFYIIDIEDPETYNSRLIMDDTHYINSNKFDKFGVVKSKTIYFENGFLDNEKLKIGIHVTLRKN